MRLIVAHGHSILEHVNGTFVLVVMILHPEVQTKAQAEFDAVVGKDRLPSLSDRSNLSYIRSILAEVFQWTPVPLGESSSTFFTQTGSKRDLKRSSSRNQSR